MRVDAWMERVNSMLYGFNTARRDYVVQHISTYFGVDFNPDDYDCDGIVNTEINELITDKPVLKLYPNPTSYRIWIDSEINSSRGQIQIIDAMGRLVYSGIYRYPLNLNVSDLSTGIYLVVIDDGVERHSSQFLKMP